MRLKFKTGYQNKLVLNYKQKNKLTWAAIARHLGVSITTVKDWCEEKNLLSEKVYKLLDKNLNFKEYILEKRVENWGRIKGGQNSIGNTNEIKLPDECEELAEFVGIILGDGNIDAYKKGTKSRTYSVRIAGHSIDDFAYMNNYIPYLIKNLFSKKASIHNSKSSKCTYTTVYGKVIVDFFSKMGIKPGNKIKNKVLIPKWVFKKKGYVLACLRGLYDTDGSIYELLPNWPGLYQLNFDNYNYSLLKQVRKILIELGYHPSKIHGNKTQNGTKIDITRKEIIKKFYKEVGTKNNKHEEKFLKLIAPSSSGKDNTKRYP